MYDAVPFATITRGRKKLIGKTTREKLSIGYKSYKIANFSHISRLGNPRKWADWADDVGGCEREVK
jgi:hypothetical protein